MQIMSRLQAGGLFGDNETRMFDIVKVEQDWFHTIVQNLTLGIFSLGCYTCFIEHKGVNYQIDNCTKIDSDNDLYSLFRYWK